MIYSSDIWPMGCPVPNSVPQVFKPKGFSVCSKCRNICLRYLEKHGFSKVVCCQCNIYFTRSTYCIVCTHRETGGAI